MTDKSDVPANDDLRVCTECGQRYSIAELRSSNANYFEAPHHYDRGCERYCLACWLGAGPLDIARHP